MYIHCMYLIETFIIYYDSVLKHVNFEQKLKCLLQKNTTDLLLKVVFIEW